VLTIGESKKEAFLVELLELLERFLLGLAEDALGRGVGVGLDHLLDPVLLLRGHLGARAAAAAGVLGAEEDRDLDLVVPVPLHQVDLLTGEQGTAEQRQRHPDGDDDRDRHRQVPLQADAEVGQDVVQAHTK
jgi:hypothetical protein